jgi:hypothetical protein
VKKRIDSMTFIFSEHLIKRMDERSIKKQWILSTIESPDKTVVITEDELHCFKKDTDFNNKWLKVVINPQTKIIVTAYFDRKMKKQENYEDYI